MKKFKLQYVDDKTGARVGTLQVGSIKAKTPFFMPVATKGNVKSIDFERLKKLKIEAVISNSLIMYWKPGLEVVEKAGGLHGFTSWNGLQATDSGGFQTLDPTFTSKTEKHRRGKTFKNPFSGIKEEISPEKSIEIQTRLGSDIMMCFDDVPNYGITPDEIKEKTEITHYWAKRCRDKYDELKPKTMLFGINQGGWDLKLRKKSIEYMNSLDFDGSSVGGLAIGEPIEKTYEMLKLSAKLLPEDKPRYAMGVGAPENNLKFIKYGYDMFDSTFPTQNARHGTLFTFNGKIRIRRSQYRFDFKPVEDDCDCTLCRNHSRAYIHHMMKQDENTGKNLATEHNIRFMARLFEKVREAIKENRYQEFSDEMNEIMTKK